MKIRTLIRAALLAALGLWPSIAGAQAVNRAIYERFDVTATSFTYAALTQPIACPGTIQTSGSSTTITATAGTPFAGLAANDVIHITNTSPTTVRRIATWTSPTEVVVDAAVTLAAGTGCQVLKYGATSGTGAENGWIGIPGRSTVTVTVETLNATSIDYAVEYRSFPTTAVRKSTATGSISSATIGANHFVYEIPSNANQVRVGLKVTTDGGAQLVNVSISSDPRFPAMPSELSITSGTVTVGSGTVTATPTLSAAAIDDGTCTSVTASTTVLASNSSRRGAIILAPAANTQITYIKLGGTATTSDFPLVAGAAVNLTGSAIYTGVIDAIAASGTQSICTISW